MHKVANFCPSYLAILAHVSWICTARWWPVTSKNGQDIRQYHDWATGGLVPCEDEDLTPSASNFDYIFIIHLPCFLYLTNILKTRTKSTHPTPHAHCAHLKMACFERKNSYHWNHWGPGYAMWVNTELPVGRLLTPRIHHAWSCYHIVTRFTDPIIYVNNVNMPSVEVHPFLTNNCYLLFPLHSWKPTAPIHTRRLVPPACHEFKFSKKKKQRQKQKQKIMNSH